MLFQNIIYSLQQSIKWLFRTFLILGLFYPVYSQDVKFNEPEVKGTKKFIFQNKSNKKASLALKQQDENTGRRLATGISNQPEQIQKLRGISVRRFLTNDKKLGADIISIDKNFRPGHIHSISRVLTSYIQHSFEYSEKDASVLAFYVLFYNAIHRGDKAFFQKKYSPDVIKALSPKYVGIGKNYKDWPGKTQIVLPLEKNILKEKKTDLTLDELEKDVNRVLEKSKKPEDKQKKDELEVIISEKTKDERKKLEDKKEELAKKEAETEEEISKKQEKLKKEPVEPDEVVKLEKETSQLEKKKEEIAKQKEELKEKEQKLTQKEQEITKKEVVPTKTEAPVAKVEEPKKEVVPTKTEAPVAKVEEPKKEVVPTKTEAPVAKVEEPKKEVVPTKTEAPVAKVEEPKKEVVPTKKEAPVAKVEEPKKEVVPTKKEAPVAKVEEPKKEVVPTKTEAPVAKEEPKKEVVPTKTEAPIAKVEEPKKEVAPTKKEATTQQLQEKLKEREEELNKIKAKMAEAEEKSSNVIGEKILFLQVVKYESDGHYTNDLWVLDPESEEGLYKSPFENICGKEFIELPTGILVVGFEGREKDMRVHHLVLLDKDNDLSLEVKKMSKEDIYWQSQLIYREGKIYAFEIKDNKVYLSRFNENLELEARSSEPVYMHSDVTFNKGKIFLTSKLQNSKATNITILNKSDLKVLKTFKPSPKKKKAK